eukprot:COSAG01_NODE_37724_length_499_cov_2.105000_1_plen_52_part_10
MPENVLRCLLLANDPLIWKLFTYSTAASSGCTVAGHRRRRGGAAAAAAAAAP